MTAVVGPPRWHLLESSDSSDFSLSIISLAGLI